MKTILIRFLIKRALCPVEDMQFEVPVPAMETFDDVKQNAMMIVGFVLAVLTQIFEDSMSCAVYTPDTFITIVASYGNRSRRLFEENGIDVPRHGQEHQLWLLDIRKRIRKPAITFISNVALHDAGGERL